jgi:rhodanese-related sulfurtransferase
MSPKSAGLAKKAGYKNIKVMLSGEPSWIKAGYPTYASTGFVSKGNIVLVDLRSTEKDMASRIPRSVSIPYADLKDNADDIPKKAPVVLYSDDEKEAMKAVKFLRGEGFKKVSLVYGNLDRWLKSKGNYESGPPVTEINWQRKLGKGEVAAVDFEKAAVGPSSGAIILDVRTSDETASGKYKSAVAIPLDELSKRLGELPKDKKIYIHCSTGARAEMAQKELQKNGFKSFFLVANVECEGSECEIEE